MVWRIVNVPQKDDIHTLIECVPQDNGDFLVQTSSGWSICELCGSSPESLAREIASALTGMRDIGFEQGRRHVRMALGLEK